MKIERPGASLPPTAINETRGQPSAAATKPAGDGGERVALSSMSATLAKAEATIADTPVVDHQRVEEIRQAIAEGRFKINVDKIADGLISSVRDMLARQD